MEATPYLNKCTEIILNLLSLNNLKLFVFAIPYWPPPCTKLCFLNLRVWDTAMSGSISFFIGAHPAQHWRRCVGSRGLPWTRSPDYMPGSCSTAGIESPVSKCHAWYSLVQYLFSTDLMFSQTWIILDNDGWCSVLSFSTLWLFNIAMPWSRNKPVFPRIQAKYHHSRMRLYQKKDYPLAI